MVHAKVFHRFALLALLLVLPATSRADKTLMWLVDWYEGYPGNTDSLMRVDSVYVPHSNGTNGYYYDTVNLKLQRSTAYAPWIDLPPNAQIPESALVQLGVPRTLARYWYVMPGFNQANFREGKVRVYWNYQVAQHQVNNYPGNAQTPPSIQLRKMPGSGQTSELNSATNRQVGNCVDSLPGDTVWIQHVGAITNSVSATQYRCYDHNPFFTKIGTVHLQNPWPGRNAFVQVGGVWYPLYPENNRPGWVTTTLWGDPRALPLSQIRFASADPAKGGAVQYMGAAGLGAGSVAPFDFTTEPAGWEKWIQPPIANGAAAGVRTTAPTIKHTLMIRRPTWSATSLRVSWRGLDAKFVANSTPLCDWYVYPLYEGAIPSDIVLVHPYQDTLFGASGLRKLPAAATDWISLAPVNLIAQDTVWLDIVTDRPKLGTSPTSPRDRCDTKVLAFRAFDWDKTKTTWNYAFGEGSRLPAGKTSTDNCPSAGGGETKGLVKTELGADGLPVWSGKTDCDIYGAADTPHDWFKKDPVVKNDTCITENLTLQSSGADAGYYKFASSSYFPLNKFNNPNNPTYPAGPNFGFCLHAKASFEYVQGLQFKFTGDDDVWVFIDKKLALDLGGQHGPVSGSIPLDSRGLSEGKAYQFDMFYCERHASGSNILVQTTMNLVPTLDYRFDSTVSGSNLTIKLSYVEKTVNASVCDDQTSQVFKAGRADVQLVFPDGTIQHVDPNDPSLPAYTGLTPNADLSQIVIDTNVLKQDPKVRMRGLYRIQILFANNPSQSKEITFTQPSGVVDLSEDIYDADGDGRADSAAIHGVPGLFATGDTKTVRVGWIGATGSADSVTVAAGSWSTSGDSLVLARFDGAFPRTTSCPSGICPPSGAVVTSPLGGPVAGLANPVRTVRERIAPVPDSARLRFGNAGAPDTLDIFVTEALTRNAASLPAGTDLWFLSGRPSTQAAAWGVGGSADLLDGGFRLRVVLPAGHKVAYGDSVRLGALAADGLGNAPASVVKAWVPLRAEARGLSFLFDRDGDGRADSVSVGARGDLSTVTSVRIAWDSAGVPAMRVVPVAGVTAAGIVLAAPFPFGATSCTLGSACRVVLTRPADSVVFPLADSVAPVAVSARYAWGRSATNPVDTLRVTVSEPVAAGAGLLPWLRWSRSSTAPGEDLPRTGDSAWIDAQGRVVVVFRAAVAPLDSVRLSGPGAVRDAQGRASEPEGHWVPIVFDAQPISVALFDANGDGQADVVRFRMIRAATGAPVPASFAVSWAGSVQRVAGTSLVRSVDGRTWSGPIGPFPLGTSCAAGCEGWITTSAGDSVSYRAAVEDSLAPVAISAALGYGLGGAPDTLDLVASEAVAAGGGTSWAETGSSRAAVHGTRIAFATPGSATGDKIRLIVPTGTIGDGDSLVRLGDALADLGGARVGDTSRWVALSAPARGQATLLDADQDGAPDSLFFEIRGRLAPGAATATWAAGAAGARSVTVPSGATGSFGLRLSTPYAVGATSCGAVGGCTVVLGDGSTIPLRDGVPPIALKARYRFGSSATAPDTLFLKASEPLVALATGSAWLDWGVPGVSRGPVPSAAAGTVDRFPDSIVAILPNTTVVTATHAGLAVAPQVRGFQDLAGTVPGTSSPLVPIEFGAPPMSAVLADRDGDGRPEGVRLRTLRQIPSAPAVASLRIDWTDASGAAVARTIPAADLSWDPVSGSWTGSIADPFPYGSTSCGTSCGGSVADTTGGTQPLRMLVDSVPPVPVAAFLRYSLPETARDTLVVALSEAWSPADAPSSRLDQAIVDLGSSGSPRGLDDATAWSLDPDGRTLRLVVDPSATPVDPGDSVRLTGAPVPRVRDASGNAPGLVAPWFPIAFGLRPAWLRIGAYPGFVKRPSDASWADAPAGTPSIALSSRPVRGTSTAPIANGAWQLVSGESVPDSTRSLGIVLTLNRPVDGHLYIYDNLGVHVADKSLEVIAKTWGSTGAADQSRQIWISWKGIGTDGKVAPAGVYLFRLVLWQIPDEPNQPKRVVNHVYRLGWSP